MKLKCMTHYTITKCIPHFEIFKKIYISCINSRLKKEKDFLFTQVFNADLAAPQEICSLLPRKVKKEKNKPCSIIYTVTPYSSVREI